MKFRMNYSQALEYIHSLGRFSLPAGLERVNAALCALGNPERGFSAIHVAGTNGKGSVCTFVASALTAAGYKTGLFTSPFIIEFAERIQINGELIAQDRLCALAGRVRDTGIRLNEFEFITVMAFLYFKEEGCNVAVLETGLGGRLDATNACQNVLCNVITKIGLDHTAVLGDTIEQIATEKCGIIKCRNVVSSPRQSLPALDVIKRSSKKLTVPDTAGINVISCNASGSTFEYKGEVYEIRLLGKHQIDNAVTALEVLFACGLEALTEDIKKGLKSAFIPARLEVVSSRPTVILDGAHNPDAAGVLCEYLEQYRGTAVAVFSAMRDKDYKAVMQKTLPLCAACVAVSLELPRAESAAALSAAASEYCGRVFSAEDVASAIKKAVEISGGAPVFVFGSLYLAAEARKLYKFDNRN